MKYDTFGNQVWLRQVGTARRDESWGTAVDASGCVYITGNSDGIYNGNGWYAYGADSAFLIKYDSSGNHIWSRQLGMLTSNVGWAVAVDASGNAFVCGQVTLERWGDTDATLAKLDHEGNLLWSRHIGTSVYDASYSVATDSAGNVFISGRTWGDLAGTNQGGYDAFVIKFDGDGNVLWSQQMGTSGRDESWAVATGPNDEVYVTGRTDGDLAGPRIGEYDAFLIKYQVPPIEVEIDVKPGSDVNPINLKSGGVIPVAILTTDDFDATTVDPDTIELSGAAVAVRGNGKHIMAEQTDVDGDGDIDLLVHIETQALDIEPGTTIVTLTGETFDGTKIQGSDDIKLVGDLNGDGTVDLVDLNIILIQWGKTGAGITDLRADTDLSGDVGLEDLNAVLIDWGK